MHVGTGPTPAFISFFTLIKVCTSLVVLYYGAVSHDLIAYCCASLKAFRIIAVVFSIQRRLRTPSILDQLADTYIKSTFVELAIIIFEC